MTTTRNPKRKAQKNRRPPSARRGGSRTATRRFAKKLPKDVEKIELVKKTVTFLDGQERQATKTVQRWRKELNQEIRRFERTARKTRVARAWHAFPKQATQELDKLLQEIGLVRRSVHEEALRKARTAKKTTRRARPKKAKTRTSTQSSAQA